MSENIIEVANCMFIVDNYGEKLRIEQLGCHSANRRNYSKQLYDWQIMIQESYPNAEFEYEDGNWLIVSNLAKNEIDQIYDFFTKFSEE